MDGTMKELKASDFQNGHLKSGEKTMVLFHATWCPFCTRLMPSFEDFAEKATVKVAVADVSDYESALWDDFEIVAVPTAILFESGEIAARIDSSIGEGVTGPEFEQFAEKTKTI